MRAASITRAVRRMRAFALLRLGYHERACSAFATVLRECPDDVAALKGLARSHARRRDWRAALAHWEAAVSVSPADLGADVARAECLLRLGKVEEAKTRFQQLTLLHPLRVDVLEGLVEALWTNNDLSELTEVAQRLWRSHRRPIAARRLVTALVILGRTAEADRFIQRVEQGGRGRALALSLKIARYRDAYEWHRLAEVLRTNRRHAWGRDGTLSEEINCLLILGRTDELRQLLDTSPPRDKALMSAPVLLALALAFGRSRVRQALMPTLQQPQCWKLPSGVLACAVAVAEPDDYGLLEETLRRFESKPHRCKDPALPLMAPFAAKLHASLAGLRDLQAEPRTLPANAGESVEARLRRVLIAAGNKGSGKARLLDFIARVEALRERGDAIALHVACDLDDALTVAASIVDAVEGRTPLSVLRLGDGEGAFLPCLPEFTPHRHDDQAHLFKVWWNRIAAPEDIVFLEQALLEAVEDADLVGIPDLEQLSQQLTNLSDERLAQAPTRMMRGYLSAVEHVLGRAQTHPRGMLTASHFHEAFVTWRLWEPMLGRVGTCSLITCHAALASRMQAQFGITVRRLHLLPPEAKWSKAFAETGAGNHYPERFEALRHELDVLPGELYLVAAGVLGKIYCQWIKAAGGVAVDIGSVADHWCGYRTRNSMNALQTLMPISQEDFARLATCDARFARMAGVGSRVGSSN